MTESDIRTDEGDAVHPLDRVVWNALSGPQEHLAEGGPHARRYAPEVAPFAALAALDAASFDALLMLVGSTTLAALFTVDEVSFPGGFAVVRRALADQMVLESPAACELADLNPLGPGDVPDMLELVATTEPGPFGSRTIEFGGYLGIRRKGRLIAMAGQRMKIPGFTEVSAVCVHPDFRGQGLAAALVCAVSIAICQRDGIPFLHVFSTNAPAIELYRKLGFKLRRRMCLAAVRAAQADPPST